MSKDCTDMLRKCLEKDPVKRISFKELRLHPAFNPFVPKTTERLGNDVKQSLFNVGYNANGHNVYKDLKQDYIDNGYIQAPPETPKENKEEIKQKKNLEINKTLVDFRNSYIYYFEIATQL